MATLPATLGVVESIVDQGRQRVVSQIAKRERFLALSFLLGGVCGLLFFGTAFFPVVLVLLVAALGAYVALNRQREREPNAYAIAQIVDARQGLKDQLATAYHFRTAGVGGPLVGAQYEQAGKAAASVSLDTVFPDEAPLTVRVAVILAGAALLFFSVRAMLQPQLSFQPPLPSVIMAAIFGNDWNQSDDAVIERAELINKDEAEELAAAAEPPTGEQAEPLLDSAPLPDEEFQPPPDDPEWKPEVEGLTVNPEEDGAGDELPFEVPKDGAQQGTEEGEEAGSTEKPAESPDEWDEDSQSLLDKLKQAFENMIETLDVASTESGEPGDNEGEGEQSDQEGSEEGEPGEGESDMPGEEASSAEMEGGEPTDQAGDSSESPGEGGEDSNEQPGTGENASAAGSNEGSKELAEAQQAEAIGELEELFMERAENMTGEVTIETHSAEQSSSVPFNSRTTTHSDRGGDVSRDEIPAEYRTYIQNYFETLRKNDK